MSETKTVVGTRAGITEKTSGWFTVEVEVPGSQYPLRLDTKREELLKEVRAIGSSIATWTYTENESDRVNPHNNRPYINRYLEAVELGSLGPGEADSPDPEKSDRMSKAEWNAKDSAIHKMACVKAASKALTHTIPSDPSTEDLNRFMERVAHLATGWHNSVIAERDHPEGDDIPF